MSPWLQETDICVVTGGSNGLGAAILKEFARFGCRTVSLDITPPAGSDSSTAVIASLTTKPGQAPATVKTAPSAQEQRQNADKELPKEETPSKPADPQPGLRDSNPFFPLVLAPESEISASSDLATDGPKTETDASNASSPTEVSPPSESGKTPQVTEDATKGFKEMPAGASTESSKITAAENDPDSNAGEESLAPTLTIKCDVRRPEDLERARDLIVEKLGRHPTVVVSNAGVHHQFSTIAETSFSDFDDIINVNLGGPIKCARTFLPAMLESERGFIITIGSALGLITPKGLGAYGASKAGIIGFHEAITQELRDYKDVHALLVCPGQLDTAMFADVSSPSKWLAPVVPPQKLAAKILKRVHRGKTHTIYAPLYVRYLPVLRAVPEPIENLARWFSGVDRVYDDVKRVQQEKLKASTGETQAETSANAAEKRSISLATTASQASNEDSRDDENDNDTSVSASSIDDDNADAGVNVRSRSSRIKLALFRRDCKEKKASKPTKDEESKADEQQKDKDAPSKRRAGDTKPVTPESVGAPGKMPASSGLADSESTTKDEAGKAHQTPSLLKRRGLLHIFTHNSPTADISAPVISHYPASSSYDPSTPHGNSLPRHDVSSHFHNSAPHASNFGNLEDPLHTDSLAASHNSRAFGGNAAF